MDNGLGEKNLVERAGSLTRVPGAAAQLTEHLIRYQLSKAEQFIRQRRPAQALVLLRAPGPPPGNWPVLWQPRWHLLVGWAMIQHNQPEEARVILEQGLQVLKDLLRRPGAARWPFLREWNLWLHCLLGASLCSNDQPTQALFCYRRALEATAERAAPDPELAMLLCKGMGDAYLALGAYADAIAFFLLAKQRGQDVYDPHAQGLIEWGLGLSYQFQGRLSQAGRAFSLALNIFERLEAKLLVSQLQSLLSQVHIWLQHYDDAEALLRQALGAASRAGDPASRAIALRTLAALYLARRKPEKAVRTLHDGLAIIQEKRDQHLTGQLYLTLARAFETQRDLTATEAALTSAIRSFQQTQHYGLLVRAYECYAKVLADQGRFQEAYEQLRIAPPKTAASLLP